MTKEKTTEEQKAQDSSLSPEPGTPNPESEPKITNMYSHGSHGGIDDEYYIDQLIGLDDFTYGDWIDGHKRKEKKKEQLKQYNKYKNWITTKEKK